jgi:hypothetical protein
MISFCRSADRRDRDLVDLRILTDPARCDVVQPAALGDELADQIHEGVETTQIHADVTAASTAAGAFGGADLSLVDPPAAHRYALDVSHRPDGGLDRGRRRGGLELAHEPAIEIV